MTEFSLTQLERAWRALPAEIRQTPFHHARRTDLALKLETLQPTGSYKIRAAYTRLKELPPGTAVALSSSGNFASAFTWAAARCGLTAHLVVTPSVEQHKLSLAKRHPCVVHLCGDTYESRFEKLQELSDQGITVIDHRDDLLVFLGHATIAWECLGQIDVVERVFIPVSTGGLALGVAAALRAGGFKGEIVGVQAAGNPTVYDSWQAGRPIARQGIDTVCDALTATSIPEPVFDSLKRYLDDILLVDERSVLAAVGYLAVEEGLVIEPGAAVGVAALLEEQRPWPGSLCIATGGNVGAPILRRSLECWKS